MICDTPESRLWASVSLLFGSRKNPPHCSVGRQWLVPLAFTFPLWVHVHSALFFSQSVKYWLFSSMATSGSTLAHTHVVQFHRVQRQGCQAGWTPGTHCDYNFPIGIISVIDHRNNPIPYLLSEFTKVAMRVCVF